MQKKDSISSLFFNTINKMYVIKIDSLDYSTDFLGTEINKQLGFETILPIKSITEGKHKLSISNYIVDKKTKETNLEKVIDIPFWYYKN